MSYINSAVGCVKKATAFSRKAICSFAEDLKRVDEMGGVKNLCDNQMKFEEREKEYCKEIGYFTQIINDQMDEISELKNKLTHSFSLDKSLVKIKKTWLQYHISRSGKYWFDASKSYACYKKDTQDAIQILESLIDENKAVLTQPEIEEIKQKTQFIEGFWK